MIQNNPLQQYFRQPAIHIKLPSNGDFYPDGSLDMPPTGEIPVYPMTAIDEITYRTPDALFNGSATTSVIQSCIPSIKNPWLLPATDVDTILVSIRIASYGHKMELESQCPHCGNEATYSVDLRNILDKIQSPDYTKIIKFRDMEIYFKPMTYQNLNDNNQKQFNEQRKLQSIDLANEGNEREKINALTQALKQITEVTVEALSQSIAAIKTPNALVNESAFIVDFLKNCDRNLFNQIKEHIVSEKAKAEIQPMTMTCGECTKTYQRMLTLDMSNFFAPRLLTSDSDTISLIVDQMESDVNAIRQEALKMSWFMRGGITYDQALNLSQEERKIISAIIKDNMETTKKSGLPFF